MLEKTLTNAGFTTNEAKIYLTLLKIGKAKSGKIVEKAKISGGKVYETLSKLIEKGVVEVVIENNVKHFIASDPESIMLYMEDKRSKLELEAKELQKVVPELRKLREMEVKDEKVYLIKGFKGIRPVVLKALNESKGVIKVMGVRSSKKKHYNIFWQNWHKEREKLRKKAKILASEKDSEYWKTFEKLKYTEIKQSPTESASAIMIIDYNSFIFSYDDEFTCIHITSESTANSFSGFFDGLWKIARR